MARLTANKIMDLGFDRILVTNIFNIIKELSDRSDVEVNYISTIMLYHFCRTFKKTALHHLVCERDVMNGHIPLNMWSVGWHKSENTAGHACQHYSIFEIFRTFYLPLIIINKPQPLY